MIKEIPTFLTCDHGLASKLLITAVDLDPMADASTSSPTTGVTTPVVADEGLAKLWESDFSIRERLRFNAGKLLVWPKNKSGNEMVGQASMSALAMNNHIMTIMAGWWCPTQSTPKTPSITVMRAQVGSQQYYRYQIYMGLNGLYCYIYIFKRYLSQKKLHTVSNQFGVSIKATHC